MTSPAPAAAVKLPCALHLLSYDESTQKFELGEDALNALRAIRGPVGVLAVCGRARQGKSFILNQLVALRGGPQTNNSKGFKVSPNVRPCTKGLWIWSEPIPAVTPTGEPYQVILLDTEGIDAYDQTGQYSTQIFSMAVLLSSLFCYNQMGGIDEAALDRLSLVTEMTKHIRVRSTVDGGGDPSELASFSPSFVWLLRDFYLDLNDPEQGGNITAAQYLEHALKSVPGGASVAAKNSIRESIRGLFPERECFYLVRPVTDEKDLRDLDAVDKSKLRPEFKQGLGDLVNLLFQRCRPKQVGNDVLNGPALAGMAKQYVAAINGGAVPAIATAWESVAEAECRRAAEAGEVAYDAAFYPAADASAADEAALSGVHTQAMETARAAFANAAIGGPELRQSASTRLEALLAKRFHEYSAKRKAEASAKCAELLTAASQRVYAAANANDATVEGVVAVVDTEVARYLKGAAGSARHERLAEFLKDTMRFALASLAQRNSQALQSSLEREQQRAEAGHQRAGAAEDRANREEQRANAEELRANAEEQRANAAIASVAEEKETRRGIEGRLADIERAKLEVELAKLEVEGAKREAEEQLRGAESKLAALERAAGSDAASAAAAAATAAEALKSELGAARAQASGAEREREIAESAANDRRARLLDVTKQFRKQSNLENKI